MIRSHVDDALAARSMEADKVGLEIRFDVFVKSRCRQKIVRVKNFYDFFPSFFWLRYHVRIQKQ